MVSDVSCNGLSDGGATVTATGGTIAYIYAWGNGETTATAFMLTAGMHTVTVTDANACTTTCDVTISENPLLTCTVAVDNNVSCNGLADGTLTATAAGGDATYEYSLDGLTFQLSGIFTSLSAGDYIISTRDGNGCVTTCPATITEPALLTCCLLYTSPSPRDQRGSRMPSSA